MRDGSIPDGDWWLRCQTLFSRIWGQRGLEMRKHWECRGMGKTAAHMALTCLLALTCLAVVRPYVTGYSVSRETLTYLSLSYLVGLRGP